MTIPPIASEAAASSCPDWMTDDYLRRQLPDLHAGPIAAEILRLRTELLALANEKDQIKADRTRLAMEMASLRQAAGQGIGQPLLDRVRQLVTENATLTAELAKLREHADHDAGEILRLGGELAASKEDGNALGRASNEWMRRAKDAESKLAERTRERDAETVRADSAEDKLRGHREHVVSIGSQRDAYRSALAEVTRERDVLCDAIPLLAAERDDARAELAALRARTRPDRVVQHDHGDVGSVTYGNCIGCIADQLEAARAEVERLTADLEQQRKRFHLVAGGCVRAQAQRDAAIRDRHEFAASELERFERDCWRDPKHPLYNLPSLEALKIRTAELRKAAPAAAPASPSTNALIQGAEDAAVEWGKCVGDYHAACRVAPPPSPREVGDAVRESGRKCEIAWDALRKAIRALAAAAPAIIDEAPGATAAMVESVRPICATQPDALPPIEKWDGKRWVPDVDATPPADLHQSAADLHQLDIDRLLDRWRECRNEADKTELAIDHVEADIALRAIHEAISARLAAAEKAKADAEARVKRCQDWYEKRWQRLRELMPKGSELEKLACDVIANGHLMTDAAERAGGAS